MASQRVDAVQDRPAVVRRGGLLLGLRELTLVPVIVLVIVIGAFASDAFLTTDNLLNILQQSSELSVVVIAETLILLTGKFDLSLELVVGLAPMLGAWLIIKNVEIGGSGVGLAWWLAIPVVLLTGAVVGAINGFLIVRLRLNAFMVTLAMLILLRGVQLGTTSGKTLFDLPSGYLYLGSGKWIGIPVSIWIAASCTSCSACFCATTGSAAHCTPSVATRRPRASPASASTACCGAHSALPACLPPSLGSC